MCHKVYTSYSLELYPWPTQENITNLVKMDEVFAKNVGIMDELHSSYNIKNIKWDATNKRIAWLQQEVTAYETGAIIIITMQRGSDAIISKIVDHICKDINIADLRDRIVDNVTQSTEKVITAINNAAGGMKVDNSNALDNFQLTKKEKECRKEH